MSQFAESDHYYLAGMSGLANPDKLKSYGYVCEGDVFYISYLNSGDTVPLFQLYGNGDHFYSIDIEEVESAVNLGYKKEGIMCFVYPFQKDGTVPLFRLYGRGDHFYTISIEEVESAVNLGYEKEGITCFVYSSENEWSMPVFRWYKDYLKYKD
jgi:hypothetical protein